MRKFLKNGDRVTLNKFIFIVILRGVTGVFQFGLLLFLTAYLSLTDLGVYSLFVIVLGYATALSSFNFPTYLLREIALTSSDDWQRLLYQQWVFLSANVLMVIVLFLVMQWLGLISVEYWMFFMPLLVLTVANNQYANFFVSIRRPVWSAMVFWIRACWIAPLAFCALMGSTLLSLRSVFAAWGIAEVIDVILCSTLVSRWGYLPNRFWKIDFAWIVRGIKIGAQYTVQALLLLLIVSGQRLVLGHYHGSECVGVFHFYYAISVFLPNLLEATLFAIVLPKLIVPKAGNGGEALRFPDARYFLLLMGVGGGGILLIVMLLPYLMVFIGKSDLLGYRYLMAYTGAFALLYTAARVFHHHLYASHNDRWLRLGYSIAGAVAVLSSMLLIPEYGLNGAAAALVVAGGAYLSALSLPYFLRWLDCF